MATRSCATALASLSLPRTLPTASLAAAVAPFATIATLVANCRLERRATAIQPITVCTTAVGKGRAGVSGR